MKKVLFSPLYFAILYALAAIFFIIEAATSPSLNYVFDFVGYGGTFAYHDLKILGLPAYWALMVFGFMINLYLVTSKKKDYSLNTIKAILIPIIFLIVSYTGGKLLYTLENPRSTAITEFSGLSLFGAIFLVPAVTWLVTRFTAENFKVLSDLCAKQGLILLTCVRTGCFITGCCGAVTLWSGITPIILPVQLIEASLDLITLFVCLEIEKRHFGCGLLYPAMMVCYGIVRFTLEFVRASEKVVLIFSASQILALICAVSGILFFVYNYKKAVQNVQNSRNS